MHELRSFHLWEKGIYTVRAGAAAQDFDAAYALLSAAPWASGLTRESLRRALLNSLCFSLFEEDRQIGLARVISDFATYAYLCDVYILESHRRRHLGSWLISCVLDHPDLAQLKRIALITHNAQDFYRRFGFEFPSQDHYMERLMMAAITNNL